MTFTKWSLFFSPFRPSNFSFNAIESKGSCCSSSFFKIAHRSESQSWIRTTTDVLRDWPDHCIESEWRNHHGQVGEKSCPELSNLCDCTIRVLYLVLLGRWLTLPGWDSSGVRYYREQNVATTERRTPPPRSSSLTVWSWWTSPNGPFHLELG